MPKTKASLLVIAATAVTVATFVFAAVHTQDSRGTAVVERGGLIRSTLLEGVVAYADEQPLCPAGGPGGESVCVPGADGAWVSC